MESFYNDALDTLGLSEDHLLEPPEALEAKHNTLKNAANWDWDSNLAQENGINITTKISRLWKNQTAHTLQINW